MNRTEAIRGRDQSIFPSLTPDGAQIKRSVHWQNIRHVLPGVSHEKAVEIEQHYGPRAGALDWSRSNVGIMVPARTDKITEHASYLGATAGRKLDVYEIPDLKNGDHPADTLIVPYVHTFHAQDDIRKLGQESWGLPPEMVRVLKNKVNFHEAVNNSKVNGFEVPDYRTANLKTLEREADQILKEAEGLYEKHDMSNVYPLGVVIRADESDGNYGGNLIIHEKPDGIHVMLDGNPLTEEIDGQEREIVYRKGSWKHAVKDSKRKLEESFDKGARPEFVLTRFMDILDSPGLSIVINHGDEESLGWNSQIQNKGTLACRGTEKYNPKNPHLARMQKNYEGKTAEDFVSFLRETAKKLNLPYESISGVVNVDIMLPGPLETKLRSKMGKEAGYYVAESNARFTNYTDGVLAVTGLTGEYPSPRGIQKVVWDGVTTIDSFDLKGAQPDAVRSEMFRLDQEAIGRGETARAFMRMPDSPAAGIILAGDRKIASARVDEAIEAALEKTRRGKKNKVIKTKEKLVFNGDPLVTSSR